MYAARHANLQSGHRQAGFSLLELTLVVLILGIMALALIPDSSPTNEQKLDLAAQIQADAMRFARSEAIRRGEPIGFRQQNNQKRIRVNRLDTATDPWTRIHDIYHPVTKQIYDIQLDHNPMTANVTLSANRNFDNDDCDKPRDVYFDSHGVPRCIDPETVRLIQYQVTLTLGGSSRTVTLEGTSGRVTIQ